MAIIRSFGTIQTLSTNVARWTPGLDGSVTLADHAQTYATIYRTQPNVRTVVDFLARNIAQLGLHVFRRISDTDRERLRDHDVAKWLSRPNPSTTRYRLTESLLQDLGIYFNAFWLKVRPDTGPLGLIRLPPEQMEVYGGLLPSGYVWRLSNGATREIAPDDLIHFSGYDPCNPLLGLSPLETLRRVLAEEYAAGQYREHFWRNAARVEGVITRPKDAGKWTDTQRQSFREQWQARTPGQTAIMEDGMEFHNVSSSAKDSEYLGARKLTREECAAAYHVPLPMVGILEHATFSNIKEQHKHLYQDCLGPWLVMIEEELERQLLIESTDQTDVYLEFNIAEKLKGSFEEQAAALQTLVGAPVMTRNEGRARLNLPADTDPESDRLAPAPGATQSINLPNDGSMPKRSTDAQQVIQIHRARQAAKLGKLPAGDRAAAFNLTRWNRELTADLQDIGLPADDARDLAVQVNTATLHELSTL